MPFGVFMHLKTTPKSAKVKMTCGVGRDVIEQTLTLTRTLRYFPVVLSCSYYENRHYYPQNFFLKSDGSKVNHIWLSFIYNLYSESDTSVIILLIFNCCRRQDG